MPVKKKKLCLFCGDVLFNRGGAARYCHECSEYVSYLNHLKYKPRVGVVCVRCGGFLSGYQRKFCGKCRGYRVVFWRQNGNVKLQR